MSIPSLKVNGLCKSFNHIKALDFLSFSICEKEVLGIIGPNGAGKTTLFNVITGFIVPDQGSIVFGSKELVGLSPHKIAKEGVARTFQNLRLVRRISVLENVMLSFKRQRGEHLRNIFFRWQSIRREEKRNRRTALSLLEQVGLANKANNPAEELSYGQQKLLSIVCCLAAKADILILDEPVAGIAPEMVEKILAMIRSLPAQGKSVILIEHNLDAVMQVCDRVIFMDAGTKVSEGMPEEVKNDPKVIEAYMA